MPDDYNARKGKIFMINIHRIQLETNRNEQSRAYHFYKRLGFYDIPRYGDHEDDVAMEMIL